jgi:glycerol-3-phosphate acyltransferase PlsY
MMATAVAVLGGYLLGSVAFAVVVSRWLGLRDPRLYGSGNPGATNVLRSGSKAAAALTLAGDALKGAVAVLLARHLGAAFGVPAAGVAVTGLAAFLGHLFPVFFRFQGGKGVATFLGVAVALDPLLGLGCCVVWLAVAVVSRYASLASITAAAAAPLLWLLAKAGTVDLIVFVAMAALLLWRHRRNIENLLAGRERRIGQPAVPRAE